MYCDYPEFYFGKPVRVTLWDLLLRRRTRAEWRTWRRYLIVEHRERVNRRVQREVDEYHRRYRANTAYEAVMRGEDPNEVLSRRPLI